METPQVTQESINQSLPGVPSSPAPSVPKPGDEGYNPLLDARVRDWQSSFFSSAAKREAELKAVKDELLSMQVQVGAAQKEVEGFRKKEKELSEKDMSELQRLNARVSEMEQARQDAESRAALNERKLLERESEFSARERQMTDERLILSHLAASGIHPNGYEQEGLFFRARGLKYESDEDRLVKIGGLIDTFKSETGKNIQQAQTSNNPQSFVNQSPTVITLPTPSVVPPGGMPAATQNLIEDNFSDHELLELARTDRERYLKIADQRRAMAKAKGAGLVTMRYRQG